MKLSLTSRLYLHHIILSRYDFTDKYINFIQFNLNLRNIKINCTIYDLTQNSLNELFFKELLTYRKFHIKKPIQTSKLKTVQFLTSIKKMYIYIFLELLLNSVFLFTKIVFLRSKDSSFYVFKFPIVFINNFFYTYLGLETKVNTTFLTFTLDSQILANFQLIKTCLFLPIIGE